MRGVDLEQLWSQQQEIDDAMDSVFGYRGLSGDFYWKMFFRKFGEKNIFFAGFWEAG